MSAHPLQFDYTCLAPLLWFDYSCLACLIFAAFVASLTLGRMTNVAAGRALGRTLRMYCVLICQCALLCFLYLKFAHAFVFVYFMLVRLAWLFGLVLLIYLI